MHEKRAYKYHCQACNNKLQKRSKTAAGSQRYHCPACGYSTTKPRQDLAYCFVFAGFVKWLLGKVSQDELEQPSRTFRNQTSWCWDVPVPNVLTGEIHQAIIVDGIKVGNRYCLISRTADYVIAWVWVPYESSQYWLALFRQLPPPDYVVCDGQKGLLKALSLCWPQTIIQRCRFHAWLNVRTKLTLRPQSKAGRELLKIARNLLKVRTKRQARKWKRQLKYWHRKHRGFMNERTIKLNPKLGERRWRYTHERLRSAYRQLAKHEDDLLHSSYNPSPKLPSTTNHIEEAVSIASFALNLRLTEDCPKPTK